MDDEYDWLNKIYEHLIKEELKMLSADGGRYQISDEITYTDTPEKRLMAAVLSRAWLDAITTYSSSNNNDAYGNIRRSAVLWFASENFSPFSFRWICHHLFKDFDENEIADWFRRTIFEDGDNRNYTINVMEGRITRHGTQFGVAELRGHHLCDVTKYKVSGGKEKLKSYSSPSEVKEKLLASRFLRN